MDALQSAMFRARITPHIEQRSKVEPAPAPAVFLFPIPTVKFDPVLSFPSDPLPVKETCKLLLDYIDFQWGAHYKPPIARIIELTSEYYGIRPVRITGQERAVPIVRPRQVAMYVARQVIGASTLMIGRAFHKDHTTVMSAIRRVTKLIDADPAIAEAVTAITRKATA